MTGTDFAHGTITATLFLTKDIIEAPWNVNVMDPEKYHDLLADMKNVGRSGTGPVDIAEIIINGIPTVTTVDGAHRLRAAKELKWEDMYAIFHHEITTEEQARLFNYRRDAERGTIDDFKLATSFKWFSDQGVKQEDIANKFGIERSTVSKRLSLLNLDPKVKKHFTEDEGLTVSHLEPIATLKPELQVKVADELSAYGWGRMPGQKPTVKEIERTVDNMKKRDKLKDDWMERLAKSKYPKCPTCKQDPVLPNDFYNSSSFLECGQGHEWSMNTGKPRIEDSISNITHVGGRQIVKSPPAIPQHVKSRYKQQDYEAAMWPFLKDLWSNVKIVEGCSLEGTLKNGKPFSIEFNGYHFAYNGEGPDIEFAVEDITSKEYNKRGFFTRVKPREGISSIRVTNKDQLKTLEAMTQKFLVDWYPGKLPQVTHGTKPKPLKKSKVKKK